MARHARVSLGLVKGRVITPVQWAAVNEFSVVHVSASERRPGSLSFLAGDRIVGAANITVTNVAPRNGGLDFALEVGWPVPINVVVDITVFEGPDQFLIEKTDQSGP